ncbi:MAG: spermidine/putrescine ABC transporter substrate-binding protein [Chloroflexota bacterium]
MKKLMMLMALIAVLGLVACAPGGPAGGPGGGPAAAEKSAADSGDAGDAEASVEESDGPQLAAELSVYNWADYIDEQILADYEAEYGVKITYDTYASNEDLLAKLQAGATGYDVIVPSDYMVDIMIDLELLAKVDTGSLSNIGNMDPQFMNAPFDPGNEHCVPYQWGTTGIGYRAGNAFFEENPPTSWSFIFDPAMLEQYAGDGINVLNDPRELPGAAAIYLGLSPNTTDPEELNQILETILAAKPFWKTFNSEDYPSSLLVPDEVVISQGWSGGVAQAYYETVNEETGDGNWYYSIPDEGAVKWLDNICITASSERYDTAVHFMNYLLDAQVGASITNFVYYGSPNLAANEFILPEILEDPSIYPPAEVMDKLQWLTEVDDESVLLYDELWTAVKAAQ